MNDLIYGVVIQGVFFIASALVSGAMRPPRSLASTQAQGQQAQRGSVLRYLPISLSGVAVACCFWTPGVLAALCAGLIAVGFALREKSGLIYRFPRASIFFSLIALMVASGEAGIGPQIFHDYGEHIPANGEGVIPEDVPIGHSGWRGLWDQVRLTVLS